MFKAYQRGRVGVIVSIALAVAGALCVPAASAQQPGVVMAAQNQTIMDPTGTYMLVWNGPNVVDLVVPGGGIARYPVANLQGPGWTRLFADNQPLPVAVRLAGGMLQVTWLTSPASMPDTGGYPAPATGPTIQQQIEMLNQGAAATQGAIGRIGSWSR